jgi:NAD(P)-dependent dehydrogenase (short-subunit alcohol dehydrogenase family)
MGAEDAKLFAQEGARVVIGDVLEDEGRRTEVEINEAGGEALFVRLDVTDEDDWRRAVEATVARFGKLNILVNNAGIVERGRVEETAVETWDQVLAVNAKGVFLGVKTVIPEMRKAGGGSIVNISSIAGIIGMGDSAAYTASKGAVRLLTKATAIQYAREGIRCNSVHPGPINTPMTAAHMDDPAWRASRIARTPLGRVGEPRDVAYGVLFLASDESSFVTGAELVIDGGYTAQ